MSGIFNVLGPITSELQTSFQVNVILFFIDAKPIHVADISSPKHITTADIRLQFITGISNGTQ